MSEYQTGAGGATTRPINVDLSRINELAGENRHHADSQRARLERIIRHLAPIPHTGDPEKKPTPPSGYLDQLERTLKSTRDSMCQVDVGLEALEILLSVQESPSPNDDYFAKENGPERVFGARGGRI